MYVRAVELIDFRSYTRVVVELEPGACVLVGPNGVGKTNLVEALHYVATLGSHRVATDGPLVRAVSTRSAGSASAGAPDVASPTRAIIRCVVVHDGRELLVELSIEPGKANRARLGRSALTRPRDVLGALRMVLFAPEDLTLVRGDPSDRRRFLDELLVARLPRFAGVRADYDRVLKQRNALLRSAYLARRVGGPRRRTRPEPEAGAGEHDPGPTGGDLSTLDVWDTHLARHGAQLLTGRLELCSALAPHLAKAYDAVSGSGGSGAGGGSVARLSYAASVGDLPADPEGLESTLAAALAEARPSEVERGMTLVGPHRDELALSIGDLPAKGYASHGESWSYALALRLAAYDLLRADGIEPVLVLDDVFAELDAGRRERLAELVGDASQVIVTCAVDADVPAALRGARYAVGNGEVRRV